MANLLLDASLWSDGVSSPPASWNGSLYECMSVASQGIASIQNLSVPEAGTVGFTLNVVTPDTTDDNSHCRVKVNSTQVFNQSCGTVGSFPFTSDLLEPGDQVVIDFYTLSGSTEFLLYHGDYEIDPGSAPVQPVAPDENLTVPRGTSSSVTPQITLSGSPVTADSLTIVTEPSLGTASVNSLALVYTAPGNASGFDAFTYKATVDGVDSNIATVNVTIPQVDCMELGRVTKSYVSAYTASRRETRRIRRFSKRCLVADFNGSIQKGIKIVYVRWNCTSPWSLLMSNARIQSDQRSVAVDAAFNFAGFSAVMATVTFDNGEVYSQEFFFETLDQPIYPQAQYLNASGPYVLEYTWP